MPNYMNLRPSQVVLDSQNPRLPDGTTSDREAINRLLDDGAEGLISLARDMAQTGESNPAELPIAIKIGHKYLVLEGNRRFAALKLLHDPALAQQESHQRAFARAAALGTPPKMVYTLIASSRDEADRWIVLRHTGENGGVGVKRWSAGQIAIHRRRRNKSVDSGTIRSITIADELEEIYAADLALVELVQRTRRDKLTNIGRFFSRDVLEALHMTIEFNDASSLRERSLWARHSAAQLRDFFYWAMSFIHSNSVDEYKNPGKRADALRNASKLIPELADAADKPFPLAGNVISASGAEGSSTSPATAVHPIGGTPTTTLPAGPNVTGSQSAATSNAPPVSTISPVPAPAQKKRPEAKPEQFLFQGLKLPNHGQRVQLLLKECRALDLVEFPGTACVMARVLVELSVSSVEALKLSGAKESDKLKDKIIAMLKRLDPHIEHSAKRDKELAHAYLEASDLGIQYLNGFVHNPKVQPDQHFARRFSSAFRPMLERIDGAL